MHEQSVDSEGTRRLLRLAESGERGAFDRLFARHRPYLLRIAELGLSPEVRARVDASDVVQETQLEAFRRFADFLKRRPMSFRLWLRRTAHQRLAALRREHVHVARRSVRREVPLPEHSSVALALTCAARSASPSDRVSRQELARCVRQALAEIGDVDREILLMRTFEGLSNQDAACVLGLDAGTTSKRYGRALLRLQKILAAQGDRRP
jgi:RNA polymerase sigma-70 factor (ECF subfamily)